MTAASLRRCLQFRLRTFLVFTTLAGIALGWWFQVFVVETHRADGSLRTQFTVRRDWRGNLVAHGMLRWIRTDGTVMEHSAYGDAMGDDEFASVLTKTGDFDGLIWLITETIVPESWDAVAEPRRTNINTSCSLLISTDDIPPAAEAVKSMSER